MNNKAQSRFILLIIISLMLVGLVLAKGSLEGIVKTDKDSFQKNFEKSGMDYGKITITDSKSKSPSAEYILLKNSDTCLIDCYAEGTSVLYEEGFLFEDMKFYDKTSIEKNLDYSVFIEVTEIYDAEIADYEDVCITNLNLTNSSEICYKKFSGTHTESKSRIYWKEYDGKKLPAGIYKWRLEAKKGVYDSVDWVAESFGQELNEWAWWDASWEKSRNITITNNHHVNTTEAGYTVSLTFDHASYVSAGDSQADGDDILIVYNNATELDRVLCVNSSWNLANTCIQFKVQADISANGTDNNYKMYYNNSGASSPSENIENVFWFADSFDLGYVNSSKWNYGSAEGGNITVANGRIYLSAPGSTIGAVSTIESMSSRQNLFVDYVDLTYHVGATGMWRLSNLTTAITADHWGSYSAVGVVTGLEASPYTAFINAVSQQTFAYSNNVGSNFSFAIDEQGSGQIWVNGTLQNISANGTLSVNNLYNISNTQQNYNSNPNSSVDEIRARIYITPEPTTSLSDEETQGGGGDSAPPYFDHALADQNLYSNQSLNYDINASDETGFDSYVINWTSNFSINISSGVLTNITSLPIGESYINVTINDTSNNLNSSVILINVTSTVDSTPPYFTQISNQTIYNNQSLSYDINATDETSFDSFVIDDTGNFSIDSSGIISNITDLNVGNYTVNVTINDSSNNLNSTLWGLEVLNSDLTNPSATNLNWITTGGSTSSTLIYLQTIDEINVTVTDENSIVVTLDVYDPDSAKVVNNQSMSNEVGDVFNYSNNFQLTKVGNWTFNITAVDLYGNTNSTTSQIIIVTKQTQSIKDGWYGYTNGGILSSGDITTLSTYGYDIFELEDNSSTIVSDWANIKNSINNSINSNIKVGLNIILDFNYSNSTEKNLVMTNISSIIGDLITTPYTSAMIYIGLELNDSFINGTKTTIINDFAENISAEISNEFVIYSKNYTAGLDTSYVQTTSLLYLDSSDNETFVNDQKDLFKTQTSLNRIYDSISDDVKTKAKEFHEGVIDNLRSTISSTTLADTYTSALTNGDILVFNNQSTAQNITVDISELTGNNGEDAWDYTNNFVVEMDNDLGFIVEVSAYSATNVIFEDLDHLQMSSLTSSYLFKGASSTILFSNHTESIVDGNAPDGNFGMSGAIDLVTELYDPHYVQANFITYYGWLNASFIYSPTGWQNYDVVIIADKNDGEIDQLNFTATGFYGYISVADYSNTTEWYTNKTGEVDSWLALNGSLNIFIDGLDYSVSEGNFSSRMKDLVDYVQIDKNKSVILNTYTAYQDFATWGDAGIMKESCVNRWNGENPNSPDNYTAENWTLELERSDWFQSHNVDVYCQAFDYRSTDGTNMILNWTDMQNIYYASKVLGYDYFYLSQPDFNYAHEEWVYNVGDDLDNSYHQSTDDANVYYRTYSNGIVYYNSSSEIGWFEDGLVVNNITACFYLYDNHANSVSLSIDINEDIKDQNTGGEYSISDGWGVGTWSWQCVDITSEEPVNGRYLINVWADAHTTSVGQGLSWAWSNTTGAGRHSWYDNSAGTNSYTAYAQDQNWMVNLSVNTTKKASVDTTTRITQSESQEINNFFLNLSSDNSFPINIWSYPTSFNYTTFKNFYFKNSTGSWVILNTVNSTDCDSDEPTWNSTTIEGGMHKVCYEQNSTSTIFRISAPNLSIKEYQVDMDNTNPSADTLTPSDNSYENNANVNFSSNLTDDIGLKNATLNIYNSSGDLYATNTTTFSENPIQYTWSVIKNLVDGVYTWFMKVFDLSGNSYQTTNQTLTVDTLIPNLTINYPTNTSYATKSIIFDITATDTNLDTCLMSLDGANNVTMANGNKSIFFDSFEDAIEWTNWVESPYGWLIEDENGSISGTGNNRIYIDGIYKARAFNCDNACNLTSEQIDLSNTINSNLTFNWGAIGFDSGEYCQIDIYNGSSWDVAVWKIDNDTLGIGTGTNGTENIDLSNYSGISNLQIRFSSLESSVTENCDIDIINISASVLNNDYTYINSSMSEGSHTTNFYCNDSANNLNNSESVTFFIDTTKPYFTHLLSDQNIYNNQSLSYDINASDDGIGLDSFAINWTSNFTINSSTGILTNSSYLVVGEHYINVSINDSLNNINSSVILINVSLSADLISPNITISNPVVGEEERVNPVNFNINTSEACTCWINISNSVYTMTTPNNLTHTYPITFSNGQYTAYFTCNDSSDNQGNDSISFTFTKLTQGDGGGGGSSGFTTISKDKLSNISIIYDEWKEGELNEIKLYTYDKDQELIDVDVEFKILDDIDFTQNDFREDIGKYGASFLIESENISSVNMMIKAIDGEKIIENSINIKIEKKKFPEKAIDFIGEKASKFKEILDNPYFLLVFFISVISLVMITISLSKNKK